MPDIPIPQTQIEHPFRCHFFAVVAAAVVAVQAAVDVITVAGVLRTKIPYIPIPQTKKEQSFKSHFLLLLLPQLLLMLFQLQV